MKNYKVIIYIFLIKVIFLTHINASKLNEAELFVQNFANNAIKILGDETMEKKIKGNKIADHVLKNVNIDWVALKLIPKKLWEINDNKDRQIEYVNSFRTYFITYLINKLDYYDQQKILVIDSKESKGGKFVIVNSSIINDGTETLTLPIKWVLQVNEEKYQIIDLDIEGISLLKSQRAEFNSILSNNDSDIDLLISKLKKINN